jgi:hypothetical protein
MVFVKPSSVTIDAGAYAYKSGVTSASFNYIDNNFVNILDKTGDTATGTINFTGPVNFSGLVNYNADTVDFTTCVINAQTNTAINVSGSSFISLATSSALIVGNSCLAEIASGGTFGIATGGQLFSDGYCNFHSGLRVGGISLGSSPAAALDCATGLGSFGSIQVSGNTYLMGAVGINGNTVFASSATLGVDCVVGGYSKPFNFAVWTVTAAHTMTIIPNNCIYPYIVVNGTLGSNSTLILNVSAPGFWIIDVSQLSFTNWHLTITNAIGGYTITTTPSGTPTSNGLIFVSCRDAFTALNISTTTIV